MDQYEKTLEQRRRTDLSFFGRIMANVSHEFNNVITVIGELSGLLQDLAVLAERGRPIQPEKLQKVTENITRHVARGKELISNMNRFSHSVDEPLADFDLRDTVRNMEILTHRLVERRQATLDYRQPEEELRMLADPFAVRHALFTCLEIGMGASSSTPALSIELRPGEKETDILLSSDAAGNAIDEGESWRLLLSTVKDLLGGRAALEKGENGFMIRITIPTKTENA